MILCRRSQRATYEIDFVISNTFVRCLERGEGQGDVQDINTFHTCLENPERGG